MTGELRPDGGLHPPPPEGGIPRVQEVHRLGGGHSSGLPDVFDQCEVEGALALQGAPQVHCLAGSVPTLEFVSYPITEKQVNTLTVEPLLKDTPEIRISLY